LKPALPRVGQFKANLPKARGEVGMKSDQSRGAFAVNAIEFWLPACSGLFPR
jgi:hypothetical protein